MTLVVTEIDGTAVLDAPREFEGDVDVTFGRSRSNEIPVPWDFETVGSHDIAIKMTGPRAAKVERRGAHYLEVNGKPVPADLTDPIIASGDTVRLGGPDGPHFRIDILEPARDDDATPITEPPPVVKTVSTRLRDLGRAVAAVTLIVLAVLGGYALYDQVYVPSQLQANMDHLRANTYLVVKEVGGTKKSAATAFVIGKDTLATNAHVTEGIRKEPDKYYLLDPDGKRIDIVSV
ncbi:MAG: hypothetical protein AAF405_04140, partial [Pseudomonadota bacterium]